VTCTTAVTTPAYRDQPTDQPQIAITLRVAQRLQSVTNLTVNGQWLGDRPFRALKNY
jgi:hypothetical protein